MPLLQPAAGTVRAGPTLWGRACEAYVFKTTREEGFETTLGCRHRIDTVDQKKLMKMPAKLRWLCFEGSVATGQPVLFLTVQLLMSP